MKNITISVPEDVARWARVYAAEQETSVSRMVGELLRQRMEEQSGYAAAMRDFLATAPQVLSASGEYPSREELYDRDVVRRHERAGLQA